MSIGFNAAEYCDRVKYEYEYLLSQYNVKKIEIDKLKAEKAELKQKSKKYFETAYYLNIQAHRLAEINARYKKLFNDFVKLLPAETQAIVSEEVEQASNVTIEDLERRIKSQQTCTDPFTAEIMSAKAYEQKKRKQQETKEIQPTEPQEPTQDEPQKKKIKVEPEEKVEEKGEQDLTMKSQIIEETPQKMVPTSINARRPTALEPLKELPHEHSVSEITFNKSGDKIFTGGKGVIKIWDMNEELFMKNDPVKPRTELKCLSETYVRSCALTNDEQSMVSCGESKEIIIWDLAKGGMITRVMETPDVPFHYALVLSDDSKYCFSCFSDGNVGMWSLSTGELVRKFTGHSDSVSCIDVSPDGTIVTGSLDKTVRVWDWRSGTEINRFELPAQVFTLGVAPNSKTEPYAAVGLENSQIEMININNGKRHTLQLHESCVLSLKYAKSSDWFVSGGKDRYLNVCAAPNGPGLVRIKEVNSILCADINQTEQYVGSGSWNKLATIYKVGY